jgi:hypothetical protein
LHDNVASRDMHDASQPRVVCVQIYWHDLSGLAARSRGSDFRQCARNGPVLASTDIAFAGWLQPHAWLRFNCKPHEPTLAQLSRMHQGKCCRVNALTAGCSADVLAPSHVHACAARLHVAYLVRGVYTLEWAKTAGASQLRRHQVYCRLPAGASDSCGCTGVTSGTAHTDCRRPSQHLLCG